MNDMTTTNLQNPARRDFIVKTAAAGGGLALGFNLHGLGGDALAQAGATPEINAWVAIKPDDTVVIRIARSEMGQGTLTGLAQLVAEELDCDWNKVTTEHINPGQSLARKRIWGDMSTGGSRGIRTSQDYVRRAGAGLLQAVHPRDPQFRIAVDLTADERRQFFPDDTLPQIEEEIRRSTIPSRDDFYIPSMSARTIVYKGMLNASQLRHFYPDLHDPAFQSAIAMVHSRFSTNTFPSWSRAHPYRYISHNGEINTLRGNINWMTAREALFASPLFDDISKILPIIDEHGSDTAILDNAVELLVQAGWPLPQAMMTSPSAVWNG